MSKFTFPPDTKILCKFNAHTNSAFFIRDRNTFNVLLTNYEGSQIELSHTDIHSLFNNIIKFENSVVDFFSSSNINNDPYEIIIFGRIKLLIRKGSIDSSNNFSNGSEINNILAINKAAWEITLYDIRFSTSELGKSVEIINTDLILPSSISILKNHTYLFLENQW